MAFLELSGELLPVSWTPLHIAAYHNDTTTLAKYLDDNPHQVDVVDKNHRTPLQIALESQYLDVICLLIKYGASFELAVVNGLKGISIFNHPHFFELGTPLIPYVQLSDEFLSLAACHAAYQNEPVLIKAILTSNNDICNKRDVLGYAPIHYSAISGSTECMTALIDNNANPLLTTRTEHSNAFHFACAHGNIEAFALLKESSLNFLQALSVQDVCGRTPLHMALYNEQWDFIANYENTFSSLDNGAVDQNGHSLRGLLFELRSHSCIPLSFQMLIPCLSKVEADWLLHNSISDQNEDLIFYSLTHNADPNCFDYMHQTPLILASKLGLKMACVYLLDNDADQSIKEWNGMTALHHAAKNGHLGVVSTLVQYQGCDCLSESMDRYTPLELALSRGHLDIAWEMLRVIESKGFAKVQDWKRLLSSLLIVANQALLEKISHLLFPRKWAEKLFSIEQHENKMEKSPEGMHRHQPHSHLKRYRPFPSSPQIFLKDLRSRSKVRKKQQEHNEKLRNDKTRQFVSVFKSCVKYPKDTTYFKKRVSKTSFYPLHEGLRGRNKDGFIFLVQHIKKAGLLIKFLSLKDSTKTSIAEIVVEMFPGVIADCGIEESVFKCLTKQFPLSKDVSFPWALVYHILSECYSSKRISITSQLKKWPRWLLSKHLNIYTNKIGIYRNIDIYNIDQAVELVRTIIDSETIDIHKPVIPYPSLLYTAAIDGVPPSLLEALIHNGTSLDLTASNGTFHFTTFIGRFSVQRLEAQRFPLTETLRRGYYQQARLLLEYGDLTSILISSSSSSSLTSKSEDEKSTASKNEMVSVFFEELKSALQHVFATKEFLLAEEIIKQLPSGKFEELLVSDHGMRFLFLCLSCEEGFDLGGHLLEGYLDLLSYDICQHHDSMMNEQEETVYTDWPSLQLRMLRKLSLVINGQYSFDHRNLSQLTKLVSLCAVTQDLNPSTSILSSLCSKGHSNAVRLILNRTSSLKEGHFLMYCAAVGGHLDVMKVLLESGISPDDEGLKWPPALGFLIYLHYAPITFYHKSRLMYSDGGIPDEYFSYELKPYLLPYCSYSHLYENSSEIEEFVHILDDSFKSITNFVDPVFIIKLLLSIPDLSPLSQIVDVIIENCISSLSRQSNINKIDVLFTRTANVVYSITDFALFFVPMYHDHPSPELYNRVLTCISALAPPCDPVMAVKLGYLDVLKSSIASQKGYFNTETDQTIYWVYIFGKWHDALARVIRMGFADLARFLLNELKKLDGFQKVMDLQCLLSYTVGRTHSDLELLKELLKLNPDQSALRSSCEVAARNGNIEALKVLLAHYSSVPKSDIPLFLSTAAKAEKVDVIEFFNNMEYIECLTSPEFTNKNAIFWTIVLKSAVQHGHEKLALLAVGNLPFSQFSSLPAWTHYPRLIYDICWWGMVDVLEGLCVEDSGIFFAKVEGLTPFHAGLCNGHIGKLSTLDAFPVLLKNFDIDEIIVKISDQKPRLTPLRILEHSCRRWSQRAFSSSDGVTDSGHGQTLYTQSYRLKSSPMISIFLQALINGVQRTVEAFLSTWGRQAGGVMYYLCKKCGINVVCIAIIGGNANILNIILRLLYKSQVLDEVLLASTFRIALLKDNVDMLRQLKIFANVQPLLQYTFNSKTGETILHLIAQYVQSPEAAQVMIEMVSNHLPQLNSLKDTQGMTALECAVRLGKSYVVSRLICSSSQIPPRVKTMLLKARGWFKLMMAHNSTLQLDAEIAVNVNHLEGIRIRDFSVKKLYESVKNCHPIMADCMLQASCGELPLNGFVNGNKSVPNPVSDYGNGDGGGTPSSVNWNRDKLKEFVDKDQAIQWLKRGHGDHLVSVIQHMVSTDEIDLLRSIDIEQVFRLACSMPALGIVKCLLDIKDHLPALNKRTVITNGFVTAIGMGHLDTAACIMNNSTSGPTQLKVAVRNVAPISELVWLIFFGKAKDIAQSICNPRHQSNSRVLLSQAWLMHEFGPYQAQLLQDRLRPSLQIMETCNVRLNDDDDDDETCLSVDYSSFISLVSDACPLYRPVVIHAACVSQLLPVWQYPPSYSLPDLHEGGRVSLSCVPHPTSPQLISSSYYGNIILSYDSTTNVFHWPAVEIPKQSEQLATLSVGPLFTIKPEIIISDCIDYYIKQSKLAYPVQVNLSQLSEYYSLDTGIKDFSILHNAIVQCVGDVLSALQLTSIPAALYTEAGVLPDDFKNYYRYYAFMFKLENIISSVTVSFDVSMSEEVSVSTTDTGAVDVNIHLELGQELDFIPPLSSKILQEIAVCLLSTEVCNLDKKLSNFIGLKIYPKHTGILYQDSDDELVPSIQVSIEHVYILKFLPLIKKFLNYFFKSLASIGKPVRDLTTSGESFNLVLKREVSQTFFDVTTSTLTLSILDTVPHKANLILAELLKQVTQKLNLTGTIAHLPVAVTSSINPSDNINFFTHLPNGQENGIAKICNIQGTVLYDSTVNVKVIKNPQTPSCDEYVVSARVLSIPVIGSPLKLKYDKTSVAQNTTAVKNIFISDVGSSIEFFVSHPNGGCTSKPRLVLPDYPVRKRIGLPGEHKEKIPTSGSVHYLSYIPDCGVNNGKMIYHFSCGPEPIQLMIVYEKKVDVCANVKCISIGSGVYKVSLFSTSALSCSLLAGCNFCQCALRIHEQGTFSFLRHFQFLSGSVCPKQCRVFKNPLMKKCLHKIRLTAGNKLNLFLNTRDRYGNQRFMAPDEKLPDVFVRRNSKIPCKLKLHHSSNLIELESSPLTVEGLHHLVINVDSEEWEIVTIDVKSAKLCPQECVFENLSGGAESLEIPRSGRTVHVCLFVSLYDEFRNPCKSKMYYHDFQGRVKTADGEEMKMFCAQPYDDNKIVFNLYLRDKFYKYLDITVKNHSIFNSPILLTYSDRAPFKKRYGELMRQCHKYQNGYTPTLTIKRNSVLESAIVKLHTSYFYKTIRIRFDDEPGIDEGGLCREFFHLLSQDIVNPQFALFQTTPAGLYRPNRNSSVNSNHLIYFNFFGKFLAKAICIGTILNVRFTPAFYKQLTGEKNTLEDLKKEDVSLFEGLQHVLDCQTQPELDEITAHFTADCERFGSVVTIELIKGGKDQTVTIENKREYVESLVQFHMSGCIHQQLQSISDGFNTIISPHLISNFTHSELEMILSGEKIISVDNLQSKTVYLRGYTENDEIIIWLWNILNNMSQVELSQLLQFSTGSASIPVDEKWHWVIEKSSLDHTHLPLAVTCSCTLKLPLFRSKMELEDKLRSAITMGGGFHIY